MKDLIKFTTVVNALKQVAAENDVNNGTGGIKFLAHFYEQEYVWDKDRHNLQVGVAKSILTGQLGEVTKLQDQLSKLPKPKIVMAWKLMEPIPLIKGTKVLHDGDKQFRIEMKNVGMLYIPEDSIALGLLEYEETKDLAVDSQGREAKILTIHLKKGIIDIAAPIIDRNDKVTRPSRAYVTAISYKSMQVAGQIMYNERMGKKRRYGFTEEQF